MGFRLVIKNFLSTISPTFTTKLIYYYNFRKWLNLKNPQGINEKLQVLKLKNYYNNDIITQCADKYRVREYIQSKGMDFLLPKLIAGEYDTAKSIKEDWESFPDKFVIKCNHGCGYNILVTDKSKEDVDLIVKQIDKWMKEDFWKVYCEPQYKYIEKKIIVEEYLGGDILTYKFYCFNGKPEIAYVSSNGENGEKDLYLDYFDMDWNWLDITLDTHLHKKEKASKPKNFDKMIKISKQLSEDFPFVRVDLYNIDGQIYLSELTFIPTGGIMKLKPKEVIQEWGNKLKL